MCLPIRHHEESANGSLRINYEWKFESKWNKLEVKTSANSHPIETGSEEEFITEHFWGYSNINATTSGEYEVAHPRWDIYPVLESEVICDFRNLYGPDFGFADHQKPHSIFVAEGSPVTVYKKKIIT